MQGKPKLLNLVIKTQNAQEEVPLELINRLIPLNKKCSRWLGCPEAYSDLITWIISSGTGRNRKLHVAKTNLNNIFMPRKQENLLIFLGRGSNLLHTFFFSIE